LIGSLVVTGENSLVDILVLKVKVAEISCYCQKLAKISTIEVSFQVV